ncbi:MAG TPA: 1,4-alpha-glucan branching protein domain-containing protein [Gemmatimonadales bacterium]|nr:1,4-alpha-glucan branching protein domain-containing protein [Gemmatimonadales bacterium]
MDFVLTLHSHLPYVLNHGRWPHGSDWLCEAALDTYLPLLEQLRALEREGVPSPVTIGFTPVLANQLVSPSFGPELEAFFDQRLTACAEAPASLGSSDAALLPLVEYWRSRFERLRELFRSTNGDLVSAFRTLRDRGALEIIGSAATHGYLPLLRRDESIRLQLGVGRDEHIRLFGEAPVGCWLPECAYRPARGARPGIEAHLAEAGFRYFFTDSHQASAGRPLGSYGDVPLGAERFDAERHERATEPATKAVRTPYRAYRVSRGSPGVMALVRDPRSSMQVWSRQQGYPGDEWYLEFHKIRWPGGLKLWRVTGGNVDLGGKASYDPEHARHRAGDHARHFTDLLASLAEVKSALVVAPFDTELFGHWWFEGVDFLASTYRELRHHPAIHPVTAGHHVSAAPVATAVQLAEGSWGVNGDHSMWLNPQTQWMWDRLWPLEDAFWNAAPAALALPAARPILAQAARELLLAQASDWQFIISTGAVPDYADRRFRLHCDDTTRLLDTLRAGTLDGGARIAEELWHRDGVFPNVLEAVAGALGTPAAALR